MDLDKWKDVLLTILAIGGGGTVAHRVLRRQQSRDKLEEAENSVGANYVDGLIGELKDARQEAKVNFDMWKAEERRADKFEFRIEANATELERLERLRLSQKAEIQRLTDQVDQLTRVIVRYRPEESERLQITGFGSFK